PGPPPAEISTLSLHDALPISRQDRGDGEVVLGDALGHFFRQRTGVADAGGAAVADHEEAQLLQVVEHAGLLQVVGDHARTRAERDRKSTRLNSSHVKISYAVF